MKIAEFLREESILPSLAATDKASVLVELCAALAIPQPGLSKAKIAEVLIEREKLGSTGVGEGVAIPHGKIAGLPGLVAAFGRSEKGLDFASIDGKPTQLFFVLLAPENSAGIHLKALARISRLFRAAPFRMAVLSATSGAEIYRLIAEEDARY